MNGKVLKTFDYELGKIIRGYNNRSLYINLDDYNIEEKEVTEMMKDKFIGGKGFGLWYLWNAVDPNTKWNDPENEIVIATGPIGGITQYPGSGKSLVVTISPLTGIPIDSNVGGFFGPYLKFAGFDALEIQGKSNKDIVIFIDGDKGRVEIMDIDTNSIDSHLIAHALTDMFAEKEEDKKNISVVSAGNGAENTLLGLLNFSFYDMRRKTVRLKQAGRGGIGTVFRDKKIKAIVAKFSNTRGDLNYPYDIELIRKTGIKLHKEIRDLDDKQNQMRKVGTAHLIEIMDEYDLLPVHNFKFGAHPDTKNITSQVFKEKYFTQNMPDGCWYGCSMSCAKAVDGYELKTGPYKGQKVTVDGPEYETAAGVGANLGIFNPDFIVEANFYLDTYGIDSISFGTATAFVMECYENGIINKDITGGLELNFGNEEAAMELLHQMARGEGFGKIVGLGIRRMKDIFVREYGADRDFLNDIGMEQKGLEYSEYVTKESLAQQGGYGFTNKGPQHDEAWLIFMDMVNNQIPTFEDKAEALHYYPMFRTWFGLNGLCKLPWNDIVPADNDMTDNPAKVPEHVKNYMDLFYAVTGKKIDEEELIRQSERVYNFQRVFNIRMGHGKREEDRVPYRSVGPVTEEEYLSRQERYDNQLKEILNYDIEGKSTIEKMKVLRQYRESQYEELTDAVYTRRGWTLEGVPTPEKLKELGIDLPEVLEVVKKHIR
mgnify:FL=1|jgi:aldehyde:ferredoxin oxidoreductase